MSAPVTLVLAGQRVVAPPRLFGKGLSDGGRGRRARVPRVDGELLLEALDPVMRTVGREPEDARIEVRRGQAAGRPAPGRRRDRSRGAGERLRRRRRTAGSGATPRADGQGHPARVHHRPRPTALKVTERVSTFTTHFPYADYRNVNLAARAELVDGTLLRPGETFSLNDTVGERTADNGFTEGYVVSDGIFKKDLGGGVSPDRDDDVQRDVLRRASRTSSTSRTRSTSTATRRAVRPPSPGRRST